MKKIFAFIILIFLFGCKTNNTEEIKVMLPTGIPLIALGGLLEEADVEDVSGTNLLISSMISQSHDIVITPFNIGAKLYLEGNSPYKLDSVITFGNTYIVSRKTTEMDSVFDLQNKKIMAYGQNSIPDFVLRSVLNNSNINMDISFFSNINLVLPQFLNQKADYILASEPVISSLINYHQVDINLLNLQELIEDEVPLVIQAALFVNTKSKNQNEIKSFLSKLEDNIKYLNTNPDDYAINIINKHPYFQSLTNEIISDSIPRSNITYLKAKSNQNLIINYCQFLNKNDENLIGGKIPDEGFYH